jgi:hypothetical protein
MKSMLFVLLAQIHAGGTQTVAAYPSLEQCRDALKVASTNVAAEYTCMATPVQGTWSQRDARYFVVREQVAPRVVSIEDGAVQRK